jgi:hypothetical protein
MSGAVTGLAVAGLMCLSALGGGCAVLRGLVPGRLSPDRTLAFGFVLGACLIGWLTQPLALIFGVSKPVLAAALVPGILGLAALPPLTLPKRAHRSTFAWIAVAALAILALGDLAEALSPVADADTLAYHFALPKQFLEMGHLVFTPRAVDGAVPLLYQMTYMVALGLGGEQAATLWCGLTGWGLGWIVWAVAKDHLDSVKALTLAALVMGIPAVLYGAGNGQVEVRLAALAVAALWSAAWARQSRPDWRWAAVAGLAGGFAMGIKYPGLLITGVSGLMVAFPRRGGPKDRAATILAYGIAAVIAGGSWYIWNWLQSGDPVFPMLFGILPYKVGLDWNAHMAAQVRAFIVLEHPVPQTLATFFDYPFAATFGDLPGWESGRTGLGPLPVMLMPFALMGVWANRKSVRTSPLTAVFLACVAAYAIWILAGPSQRVRHLLPVMVPATLVLAIAAWRAVRRWPPLDKPLTLRLVAILLFQAAGQAVFTVKNLRYLLNGEDRETFLESQIPYAPIARWVNVHTAEHDKIATTKREMVYLIDRPVQMVAWLDGRIQMDAVRTDPQAVVKQLRHQGIAYLIADESQGEPLVAAGCAKEKAVFSVTPLNSRTLQVRSEDGATAVAVFGMTDSTCPY